MRIFEDSDICKCRKPGVLLAEMAALAVVSFIPEAEEYNLLANTLVSFACAMQMEAFGSFVNQPIATTVSTGNLRKLVEYLVKGFYEKDKEAFKIAGIYFLIVSLFILGVIFGTLCSDYMGIHSVWIVIIMMFMAFMVITTKMKITND